MNEVQSFVTNFSGNEENTKEIIEFFHNKSDLIGQKVT
jgi:hypothetical protein